MSQNNQKPNVRGFVDRFHNTTLNQTSEQSSKLISKKEDQINKQNSQKKVLKNKKPPYLKEEFVNDRPTPGFIINKRNPT